LGCNMLLNLIKVSAVYHATRIADDIDLRLGDAAMNLMSSFDVPAILINEHEPDSDAILRRREKERDLDGVVIAAAGNGTRMGELTAETPKPMLKHNGKFLIDYPVELALESGFDKRDIFVMGRNPHEDSRFRHLDFYTKTRGLQTIYQRSRPAGGHLMAFLRELYGNPDAAKRLRPYRRIAFIPSDAKFDSKENIRKWMDEHGSMGASLMVTEGEDADVWVKESAAGKYEGFWAKKPSCEMPYNLKPLRHTGAYILDMRFLHNLPEMMSMARIYHKGNGFIPEKAPVGFVYTGGFREFNNPNDLRAD